MSSDDVSAQNWTGALPVIVTLAPTSLSSPTMPAPVHVLVSRSTYLHVGLQSAVERLHKFAPTTLSFLSGMIQNEPEAGAFDQAESDQENSKPVLPFTSSPYPVCWFEDEHTGMALRWHLFAGVLADLRRTNSLPWKIRLHFTAYPSAQILPLESSQVLETVQHYYKNSLKQALCLEYGTSKTAMNVTKVEHGRLWEAVATGNYALYQQVNADLQISSAPSLLPVRVHVNARPPLQRACRTPDETLLQLLQGWLPEYFTEAGPTLRVTCCRIAGFQVPLSTTTLHDVWRRLCHPDHFLYILILTDS